METRIYRAAPGTYVALGIICCVTSALWALIALRVGIPWEPAAAPFVGFGLVSMWLGRFRVTHSKGELTLVAPFHPRIQLAMEDILSIEFATETGRRASPYVLCIRTCIGEEVRFNARVFQAGTVQHLLALAPRAKPQPGHPTPAKPQPKSRR